MTVAAPQAPRGRLKRHGELQTGLLRPPRRACADAGPVRAPGLSRCTFGGPSADEGEQWTAEYEGRRYRLFFILGHARSGTNWTGALLNLHPRIHTHGEFRFESLRRATDDMVGKFWHGAYNEPMRSVAEECFRESVKRILVSAASQKPQAAWIGDRTPRSLQTFVASAPHIMVIRDPRDVLTSLAFHQLSKGGVLFQRFASQLGPLREEFLADTRLFERNPERLLSHQKFFRTLVHGYAHHVGGDLAMLERIDSGEFDARVLVVCYERLHEDTEQERAKMYRFLGEDPAAASAISADSRTTPGFGKESPDLFYRKGRAGDWRRYFTDETKGWFKEQAGDLLIRLGYATDQSW